MHKYGEGGKVAVRNIRRDAMDKIKAAKKKSEITEDDQRNLEKKLQGRHGQAYQEAGRTGRREGKGTDERSDSAPENFGDQRYARVQNLVRAYAASSNCGSRKRQSGALKWVPPLLL